MILPEQVLKYDDIHGSCISRVASPNVLVYGHGCNFKLEKQKVTLKQGTNDYYCTDFVIRNVTATCKYLCGYRQTQQTRTVVVKGRVYIHVHVLILLHEQYNYCNTEAKISPTPLNVTTFEGMPVKLKCTVKTTAQLHYYKLVWMKEDVFVTGTGYSVESTQFHSGTNIENHYLIVHKASPGTYTCKLISTNWKVIDAKTQYIVTESEHFTQMSRPFSYT